MKSMIMKLMMSISIMSIMLKTPMALMTLLMMQTTLIIMLMNKSSKSSWFSMVTFLMMIGGILIIFMYMSSITSNKKFKNSMKILMTITLIMMIQEEMMIEFQINENEITLKLDQDLSMTKMYNKTMSITMIMVTYLLLTMMSINKIIKNFEGPMRSKTYE